METLRRASALAHVVDGAVLRLLAPDGAELVVGRHPAADVGPCEWRRLMALPCAGPMAAYRDGMELIDVAGTVSDLGGGLFRSGEAAGETHWFATGVCGAMAGQALRDTPLDEISSEHVTATIRSDAELAVSIVGMRFDPEVRADRQEELVRSAYAGCLIAELDVDLRLAVRGRKS